MREGGTHEFKVVLRDAKLNSLEGKQVLKLRRNDGKFTKRGPVWEIFGAADIS
jgi:hypothetical protein